jgi:hypothetical protein
MQLISTLASGVLGAENGYARIFVRGSTKRARYYTDFEGLEAVDASDVQLDANGGAVVYTNITVDVFVYGENDLLIRRWVESSTDGCVEVISPSFTGADYETGVGGPNKPTTAASVFDRLIDSFGAEDFLVKMPDGSELPLQEAIASIPVLYFNVKSPIYGATGGGLAPDRAAIQAAINAAALAGGGIVFFPAGDYLLDGTTLTLPPTVSLLGSGPNASKLISPATLQPAITVLTAGIAAHTVTGLRFSHNTPAGNHFWGLSTARILFRSCAFEVRAGNGVVLSGGYVVIDDCDFTLAGAGRAIDCTVPGRQGRMDVRRCRFVMLASGTTNAIITGANIHLLGCYYDGRLSNVPDVVVFWPDDLGGNAYGSARCCEFIDSATRPVIGISISSLLLASEWFTEDGNFILRAHANSALVQIGSFASSPGYYCKLGSRENRIRSLATAAATINLNQTGEYGIFNIRSTFAGGLILQPDVTAPFGARLKILLVNADPVLRNVSFGSNARGGAYNVSPNECVGFELVRAVANNGVADVPAWYVVGTSGCLTTGVDASYPV